MKFNKSTYYVAGIISLCLGIFYITTIAHSSGYGHGYGGKEYKSEGICLKSLGLSDGEIEVIKNIKLEHKKRGIDIRAEKEKAMLDLKALVVKGASKDEILPKVDVVVAAKRKCLLNRIECLLETSKAIKDKAKRKTYLEKIVDKALTFGKGRKGHSDHSEIFTGRNSKSKT